MTRKAWCHSESRIYIIYVIADTSSGKGEPRNSSLIELGVRIERARRGFVAL